MSDTFVDGILHYCKKYKVGTQVEKFWLSHRWCEVCGMWAEHPHHIRTRGAGGDDDPRNLLALCTTHHTEVGQIGNDTFSERYPRVAQKICAALERERTTA